MTLSEVPWERAEIQKGTKWSLGTQEPEENGILRGV